MTRRIVAAAVLFAWCAGAHPQFAAAQERITLEDAQARAVEASHRLAEARARAGAAESAVAVRAAADNPMLALQGGYTRTNHVTEFSVPGSTGVPRVLYPDVPNNLRSRIDLQWPIYTGGRTNALERAARAEAAASTADVAAAQADLRLDVARAFWSLVTARATVTVLERSLERAGANVNDVRARQQQGLIPPNELASAQAQESRQRMLLIEAQNQSELSAADLGRLLGLEPGAPVPEPAAALEAGGADPAAAAGTAYGSAVAQARAARQDRRAIELRIDAAVEQQAAAGAGMKPTIALAGGYDYARPNPRIFPRADRWEESWDAGVNVSWPLWDGGRTKAESAQAAQVTEAARQRLREFDSLVALEVRQRQLDISSSAAAIAASEDAVRAATEARRVLTERYNAGVATQTEVLDADIALLQAELDRTRALANLRLAEARLARATGR